jgi:hypothetical protein
MEFITSVKDFSNKIKTFSISENTNIRVIIDNSEATEEDILLKKISREEQRRLLNLIPNEYQTGASKELITIIENSHTNTDVLNLE